MDLALHGHCGCPPPPAPPTTIQLPAAICILAGLLGCLVACFTLQLWLSTTGSPRCCPHSYLPTDFLTSQVPTTVHATCSCGYLPPAPPTL